MTYFLAFGAALAGTCLIGVVARFLIGLIAPSRSARFGAFCLAIGMVAGRFSYFGTWGPEAARALCAAAGAVLGLSLLWYWYFMRKRTVLD